MKQVKKLLVILPLVALFVLGSLPVLADDPSADELKTKIDGERTKLETLVKEAVENEDPTNFAAKLTQGNFAVKPADKKTAKEVLTKTEKNAIAAETDTTKLQELLNAVETAIATFVEGKGVSKCPSPVDPNAPKGGLAYTLTVRYHESMDKDAHGDEETRLYNFDAFVVEKSKKAGELPAQIAELEKAIGEFVENQLQDGYEPFENTYRDAAFAFLKAEQDPKATTVKTINATVDMGKDVAKTVKVIAYDIHSNSFVYDRLFKLELRDGWKSEKDASESFYNNTVELRNRYLYAGYATKKIKPVIVYRGAYLEQIAKNVYLRALNRFEADVVCFVVPRTIDIKTIHVFPEGTRADLIEYVPVPYEVWASLQHSSQFMNLPEIFKTRIQKVNEEGFAFREIRYYNGINEITGLVSGYDWYGFPIAGDADGGFCARIFYDKAVAAAKEVPTEKKVDAASAPQAQIQAPAGQAPVTAANTTTTTAPANTLPVTGASDSIFLFLSSAALMAVGILFFKKH